MAHFWSTRYFQMDTRGYSGSRYGRRAASRYGARTRRDYNASQQSKTMVVTNSRTTNSANRVGGNGLNRLSVGKFRDLPTLWPDKFLCKMKYQDTVNTTILITGGQQTQGVNYKVNSLYDPLQTTAAEQSIPGFLELANMYGYYRVHAAKITANIGGNQGPYGALAIAGLTGAYPNFSNYSTYASMLQATANPYVVYGLLSPSLKASVNLETYCNMNKLVGSKIGSTDDDYAASVTADPKNLLWGYVAISVPVNAPANLTYTVTTEIEFWCEFYGRDFEYS